LTKRLGLHFVKFFKKPSGHPVQHKAKYDCLSCVVVLTANYFYNPHNYWLAGWPDWG
jgi:hypothetical protein